MVLGFQACQRESSIGWRAYFLKTYDVGKDANLDKSAAGLRKNGLTHVSNAFLGLLQGHELLGTDDGHDEEAVKRQ